MTDHGPTCSVDKSTAARPTAVRRSVPGVRKLAVFALLISGALPGQRGFHVEPDLGLRIKVPAKWERYPGEKDRRFERGYYVSNKTYPVRGMRGGHRPTLRVLVLPKAGAAAAAAQQAVTPQASVPYYIDYRDYLCRNLSGALTWDKTEQVEVAGQPCKRFQVQCRDADQAYALTTWVLELRGHLVAVECMVHRQHVDKVTPLFEAALRSCRVTEPRPATADPSGGPAIDPFELPPWLVDPAAWRALPLRQRQERRAGFAERFMAWWCPRHRRGPPPRSRRWPRRRGHGARRIWTRRRARWSCRR
jgi:hypothetical protein